MFAGKSTSQMDAEAATERKAEKRRKLAAAASSPSSRSKKKDIPLPRSSTLGLVWEGESLSQICKSRQGMYIEEEDNVALCTACKLGNYAAVLDLLYMGVDPCWQDNLAIRQATDTNVVEIIGLLQLQPGVPGRAAMDDLAWADALLGWA